MDSNGKGLINFQRTENLDERNDCLSNGCVLDRFVLKNAEKWTQLHFFSKMAQRILLHL